MRQPFKNVKLNPEVHYDAKVAAVMLNIGLAEFIEQAIIAHIAKQKEGK